LITLNKLLERATGNQRLERNRIFRPSTIYRLLNDPFGVWCDYHAPKEEAVEEVSKYEEMRMSQGVEFEDRWVHEHYPEALHIHPDYGFEALKNSLQAMIDGVPVIHTPQLWSLEDEVYGKADLLVRSNEAGSDLGDYHYRVEEIKRSKNLQNYHVLQAGLYNRMLGLIQGYVPSAVTIVLKDHEDSVPYDTVTAKLDEVLLTWRQIRDGLLKPEPMGLDKTDSPWRVYANKLIAESKDLTLLPDIGPSGRAIIREKLGVNRIDGLYDFTLPQLVKAFKEKMGTSLYYHAQAYSQNKPILAPGAAIQIPRNKRHIYFDFETSDEVHPTEPPHVYLIGAWDGDQNSFFYVLGRGAAEEEHIFKKFMEYVGNPEDCCLYHWTDFEIRVMRKVAEKHSSLAADIHRLIQFCIDLKEVVKTQVYLPVPTYSIKSVAPALGFHWRHKDVGAFESMTQYWDFLASGDVSLIKTGIDYNEDDCRAMYEVDRRISEMFGGRFI
jgi:uncharacterized protein